MVRTQDEIVTRMKAIEPDDFLGFAREVLLDALDFEHAKPFLVDDATPEKWAEAMVELGPLEEQAKDYLAFAYGKADDHRGISAGRSVSKMTEFMWLMGRDDVVVAIESVPYPQYGVPKLAVISRLTGWPGPEGEELERMARGEPCRPDCMEGCGT
jgi:hypothetical protein